MTALELLFFMQALQRGGLDQPRITAEIHVMTRYLHVSLSGFVEQKLIHADTNIPIEALEGARDPDDFVKKEVLRLAVQLMVVQAMPPVLVKWAP